MTWQPIETVPDDKDREPLDLWVDGRRWTDMVWQITCPTAPDGAWKRSGEHWAECFPGMTPTHWMRAGKPE
jgi:hypothetical protein